MRYRWMPPSADSTLGATRKGSVVDLDDAEAARIRRAWHPIDPLVIEPGPLSGAAGAPSAGAPHTSPPPPAAPPSPAAPEPPVVEPPSAAAEWLAPIVEAEDAANVTAPAPEPKRPRRRSRR